MASSFEYKLKRVKYKDHDTCIILQNENGPCPAIALANVLLLRGVLTIHPDYSQVDSGTLLGLLGDQVMKRGNNAHDKNLQYSVDEALCSLPSLEQGLNVNVRFNDVQGFEYLANMVVFDVLEIRLLHGWLVDPSDEQTAHVFGCTSFNQVEDRLLLAQVGTTQQEIAESSATSGESADKLALHAHEIEVIKEFLETTASQLTWYGLAQLHHVLREGELAVLFRNNHFGTIVKANGQLYLLVTDTGYKDEAGVVWERLCEVSGDSTFVDASFQVPAPVQAPAPVHAIPVQAEEDEDHLLALALQEQEYDDAALQGTLPGGVPSASPRTSNAPHMNPMMLAASSPHQQSVVWQHAGPLPPRNAAPHPSQPSPAFARASESSSPRPPERRHVPITSSRESSAPPPSRSERDCCCTIC